MPGPDFQLLSDAAREAGAIALRYWRKDPQVWEKPGLGPVTEADLAVNAYLLDTLRGARPGYGWLSEETTDTKDRLSCEQVFIIDPIDGTRAFVAGEKHFAVSIGLARAGRITDAAIYLPALDLLYTASANGPALRNGQLIQASAQPDLVEANILMSKGLLAPDHWHHPPRDLRRSFRPSIAYRLCLVADGSFDGMISLRDAWEWDIAAGSLIADRAGAAVTDRHGQPLCFNAPGAKTPGIFCAAPGVHAALLTDLKQ